MTTTITAPIETRSLLEPPEFRSTENGTKLSAAGVAMRYGVKSKPLPDTARARLFRETFRPGAFSKTLTEAEVRSHNEHHGPYLASTSNGTLRFEDTPQELRYELDLPNTGAGRDAATLLERRDIRGSSVGFFAVPKATTWSVDPEDGIALRTVGEARLTLCDLTVAPAYNDSTAALALRSLADERGMDLRSLLEAADRGELPTLIASEAPLEDDGNEEEEDDGREITVIRPPLTSLLL